ncbi:MAG: hypothetical protein ACRDF0_08190 [Candidatus Limnocylindria bacterium]
MSSSDYPSLKIEKSCPLASAHTRLRQSHDLWHRVVAAYPDPDEFVLQLNQLIVTLRQVTFMLQKQKTKIDDFDTWYGEWQDRLRADPIMKWLHDARTHIEKRGDLELASTARVELVAGWLPGPYADLEVPPLIGPDELAPFVKETFSDLPESISKQGVLRVERRWISKDFPDRELTEICAYGYGVMATMLAEAHERLGLRMRTFGGETHGGQYVRVDHLGGRLPCMVITDEERTAHVHLGTGELMQLESRAVSFDPEKDDAWAQARSEEITVAPDAMAPAEGMDPLDFGAQVMSVARRTLAHDGYHWPHAFLYTRDLRPITVLSFRFEDQAEKYMGFRQLARDVDRLGADVVIFVDEVWMAPVPEEGLTPTMLRASERADRKEALEVIVATSDGRLRTYYSPFGRDREGNPVFEGEVAVAEGDQAVTFSLLPLQAVWARWREQSQATERRVGEAEADERSDDARGNATS